MPARSPIIVSVVCVGLVAVAYALPGNRPHRDDGWTVAGFNAGAVPIQADAPSDEKATGVEPGLAHFLGEHLLLGEHLPAWRTFQAALGGIGFAGAGMVGEANAQSGEARSASQQGRRAAGSEPRFSRVVMDPVNGAIFDGTGPAGADIVLWRKGRPLGRATVSPTGKWSVQLDQPFESGDHSVTLAVSPDRGSQQVFGQEVRISIPRNFRDGGAVTIDVPEERVEERGGPANPEPGSSEYAEALRRRAEELARAASERFSQVVPPSEPVVVDPGIQAERAARQTGQTGQTASSAKSDEDQPAAETRNVPTPERRSEPPVEVAGKSDDAGGAGNGGDGSVLAPVLDWLERSAREYQTVIVPGLSDPPKAPEDLRAGPASTNDDGGARVADEPDDRAIADARRPELSEQEMLNREALELRRLRAEELRARKAQDEAVARAEAEREAAERAEALRMRERSLVSAEDAARGGDAPGRAPKSAEQSDSERDEQRQLDAEAEQLRLKRLEDAVRLSEEQRRQALDAQVARLEAERARKLAEGEQARRDEREARDREALEARRAEEERQRQARLDERDRANAEALRIAAEQRRDAIINAKLRRAREIARLDDLYRSQSSEAEPPAQPGAPSRPGEPASATAPVPAAVDTAVVLPERRPVVDNVDLGQPKSDGRGPEAMGIVRVPPLPDRDETKRPVRIDVSRIIVPEENQQRRLAVRTVYEQGSALRGPVDDNRDRRHAENRYSLREPKVRYRPASRGRSNSCHARAGKKVKLGGVYIVAPGDTLWAISRRHYKLGRRYPIIYRANRKKIKDPDLIYPCQRLYLPRR